MHNNPNTYKQAIQYPEWIEAMGNEIKALESNETWELKQLPKGKKALGCKWVYKTKLKPDGSIEKLKARLVAKGFHQIDGIDYHESFAPVAKTVTIRIMMALTAANGWHLHQIDVNNAFLHGTLEEDIYMKPPLGYEKAKLGEFCKLKKTIYGLKQSSRQWNLEISKTLIEWNYIQSTHDNCLFINKQNQDFTAILLYVDDMLIASNNLKTIQKLKQELHKKFPIKDLGEAKYFLGIEIARNSKGIYLNQRKYILDIIDDVGLMGCKPAIVPMQKGSKIESNENNEFIEPEQYRRLVGRLLYLNLTRPDLSYSVQKLSQYMQKPTKNNMDSALQIVKYLKGNPSLGIMYQSNTTNNLKVYADADWASCTISRKSITGYCIFFGQSPISWKTKKQTTVSRSSAEAEYRSLANTVCEVLWISYILKDFKIDVPLPINVYCDNQAAIHITKNPVFHERTKHLDIDCHVVRNQYKLGLINLEYISSKKQVADMFTKPIEGTQYEELKAEMNLQDFHLEEGM